MSEIKKEVVVVSSENSDPEAEGKKVAKKPSKTRARIKTPVDSSDEEQEPKKTKVTKPRKIETATEPKEQNKNFDTNLCTSWAQEELLSDFERIDLGIARNIVRLFADENTIPFIARYRKELTGHMSPEKLRDVRKSYDDIIRIQNRAKTILSSLISQGKLNDSINKSILSARSLGELEHIYAPFKVSKNSLAERAKQLGLGPIAIDILHGIDHIDPSLCIVPGTKGLDTLVEVLHGIQHIIADAISKNRDVLDYIHNIHSRECLFIESSMAKTAKTENTKSTKSTPHSSNYQKNKPPKNVDLEKFKLYFDFKTTISNIKPYQTLALNRGESLKILNITISVPERLKNNLYKFCEHKWLHIGKKYSLRSKMFRDSFNDAYKRFINPLIVRETRAHLGKIAQKASVEVFSNNLKHLLLTQPVKGKKILGIDPGFANGCKMALISERGELLDTSVIYPHTRNTQIGEDILTKLMHKHNCQLIALGNGTACRETESFLGALIKQQKLPHQTKYSIINERGASIYSCSDEATKEFPKLDPNLRSAVYIARCLQDPLCEMVKIDPKHLGVGMYQHDVPERLLSSSLREVVVECVSFVGVDINTVSNVLLKQVAGLNGTKADKIIEFRNKFGPFVSRERLKDVPGIGPKSFEQFAGFIRIVSQTSGCTDVNPLDATWVHPESYSIAVKICKLSYSSLANLGSADFIRHMQNFAQNLNKAALAKDLEVSEERINLVIESLCKNPEQDYRCDSKTNEPLFKCNVTSITDLKCGSMVTGVITNVTHFGSFVDIGVGVDGLIHTSMLKMFPQPVELGNRVEVKVDNVDVQRKRIGLCLLKIL